MNCVEDHDNNNKLVIEPVVILILILDWILESIFCLAQREAMTPSKFTNLI